MPWYAWVILGLGTLIALAAVAFRLLRASKRGRRFLGLSTRAKIRFGRILLGDSQVGIPGRAAIVILIAYLALPFDLIPDFIPVIGQLDDVAVTFLAIALLLWAVPRDRFEAALDQAEADDARRALQVRGETPVAPDA